MESILRERAGRKGLELRFDISQDGPRYIRTDARKLSQVLINLLSNAIKFTNSGSVILRVTVTDREPAINDPYSSWGTSWGTLAQDGWRAMRSYPHVLFFPATAIFLTILAFNFLGNHLRDWLAPKAR